MVTTASGVFSPGHIGELTRIVPFEMVDAVVAECGATQRRLRLIPSRVVVYLLLAAGLFTQVGWSGVWRKLVGGIGAANAEPVASALLYARKRLGPAPMQTLFELLANATTAAARWRGLLVCAIDGTVLDVPASQANLAVHRSSGHTAYRGAGYPQVRLVALVACGSRALLGAVFGPIASGETTMTAGLVSAMRPGQVIVADRGFDAASLLETIAATGADVLVRLKDATKPGRLARLADGTYLVQRGSLRLRMIDATITISTTAGKRVGHYRIATSLTDPDRYPAGEIVTLYHQRWEIETVYAELKPGLQSGRILRSKDPAGLDQEIWALLCLYQVIRIAIADALTSTGRTGIHASFTIAREAARDQLIRAEGIIDDETINLKGHIGHQVLAHLLPSRRIRTAPRVVKRALSKHPAKGQVNRRTYKATLDISVLASP